MWRESTHRHSQISAIRFTAVPMPVAHSVSLTPAKPVAMQSSCETFLKIRISKALCTLKIHKWPIFSTGIIVLKESKATKHSRHPIQSMHCDICHFQVVPWKSSNITHGLHLKCEARARARTRTFELDNPNVQPNPIRIKSIPMTATSGIKSYFPIVNEFQFTRIAFPFPVLAPKSLFITHFHQMRSPSCG